MDCKGAIIVRIVKLGIIRIVLIFINIRCDDLVDFNKK